MCRAGPHAPTVPGPNNQHRAFFDFSTITKALSDLWLAWRSEHLRNTWSLVSIVLLGLGLLIRAALYFPLAMFQVDSDGVLAGLCAFRIAGGQFPVFFPGGSRLGAASCYAAAAYFHLFGPGRVALAFVGLTWGLLFLVFILLFLRTLLGERLACLAMVFAAVPPEQFMTVTYVPWGYGEIIASCAATLWLAALWRRSCMAWQRVAFGLSVGLGIWFSLQTLMVVVPVLAWIALTRRRAFVRESIPAICGAIVGATPFLLGNLFNGLPSFTNNWASQAVPNGAQVFDNAIWLFTWQIPKLLVQAPSWWSTSTFLIVGYAIVAVGFMARAKQVGVQSDTRSVYQLFWLVFIAVVLFYIFSNAGSRRGWTVRYIAPLYLIVPMICAIGLATIERWSRWLVVVAIGLLTVPNLLLYSLPGTAQRAELTSELVDDMRIREALAANHVAMVYGNYFWVYHLNFDSHERIAGVPSAPVVDYYEYGVHLGSSPVRWALLGGADEVKRLTRAVHAHGISIKDGDLSLFIADHASPNAATLIAELRSSNG